MCFAGTLALLHDHLMVQLLTTAASWSQFLASCLPSLQRLQALKLGPGAWSTLLDANAAGSSTGSLFQGVKPSL